MNRAVAIDAGDIGGPYHGSFVPSGTARRADARAARPDRHRASRSAGGTAPPASAVAST